jgi:glycosyltransferase involved in cell wall biosynthesis
MPQTSITVIIPTFNRAILLSESIKSILEQTVGPVNIVVLDNGSTDNTKMVVESFVNQGVVYMPTADGSNIGWYKNFVRAINLVWTEYCIIFHDDDILHSKYLGYCLDLLNTRTDCVLSLAHGISAAEPPSFAKWAISSPNVEIIDHKELAARMYNRDPIPFCGAVYRSSVLKKVPIPYEEFGKFCDKPWLINIAKHGVVGLFNQPLVFSRQHIGQATIARGHDLSTKQILQVQRYILESMRGLSSPAACAAERHRLLNVLTAYSACGTYCSIGFLKYICICVHYKLINLKTIRCGIMPLLRRTYKNHEVSCN